jgi:hypothetical protein
MPIHSIDVSRSGTLMARTSPAIVMRHLGFVRSDFWRRDGGFVSECDERLASKGSGAQRRAGVGPETLTAARWTPSLSVVNQILRVLMGLVPRGGGKAA